MNSAKANEPAKARLPIIQTGQAIESLRDSGHSLPTALAEVIDNSLEAKANEVHIHLVEGTNARGKRCVERVVIADDGAGMDPGTLHRCLIIGFSTRYMRTDSIGKYGVGAKLAALNLARRIDIWSRQSPEASWQHVYFDLDEALSAEREGQSAGVAPPRPERLPDYVPPVRADGVGTVVAWSSVDRLEEGRSPVSFDELRSNVEKELARIFRYFLNGGKELWVNGRRLLAHDPLFLMEQTWADEVLTSQSGQSGKRRQQQHFPALLIADEPISVGDFKARLRVTLYPEAVLRGRGKGGDELAKKLRVPENQGAVSFVRLNREIEYTTVPRIFPRGVQKPDRFIGIEVSFSPELDSYFGVRNVKRGVEPHGELRTAIQDRLSEHLASARKELARVWGQFNRQSRKHQGEHAAIARAVQEVDLTMPRGRASEALTEEDVRRILEDLARDVGHEKPEEQRKYLEGIAGLPFVVETVDFAGNMFITTHHLAEQVIVRVNARHRFYRDVWEPLRALAESDPAQLTSDEAVRLASRSVEGLTLLLIAYAKAETMHPRPNQQYGDLVTYWGQFLETLMGRVKEVL